MLLSPKITEPQDVQKGERRTPVASYTFCSDFCGDAMRQPKVVIVGAGLVGGSAALFAAVAIPSAEVW